MRIRETIKEKGFTIEAVANKIGITRVTLSQNIAGNPSYSTMKKIADAIGCNVGDFFSDELDNSVTCPNCGAKLELKQKQD